MGIGVSVGGGGVSVGTSEVAVAGTGVSVGVGLGGAPSRTVTGGLGSWYVFLKPSLYPTVTSLLSVTGVRRPLALHLGLQPELNHEYLQNHKLHQLVLH